MSKECFEKNKRILCDYNDVRELVIGKKIEVCRNYYVVLTNPKRKFIEYGTDYSRMQNYDIIRCSVWAENIVTNQKVKLYGIIDTRDEFRDDDANFIHDYDPTIMDVFEVAHRKNMILTYNLSSKKEFWRPIEFLAEEAVTNEILLHLKKANKCGCSCKFIGEQFNILSRHRDPFLSDDKFIAASICLKRASYNSIPKDIMRKIFEFISPNFYKRAPKGWVDMALK